MPRWSAGLLTTPTAAVITRCTCRRPTIFLAISSSLLAVNEVKMCSTRAERKNPGRVLRPDDSGIAVHTVI
ncbi:hypothetical protein EV122DRAFT_270218 [Schizophyllum commune]